MTRTCSSNTPAFKFAQSTPLPMNPNDPSKPSRKHRPGKGKEKEKFDEAKSSSNQRDQQPRHGAKLRGQDRDSPDVRISKTLSWLLRHGAQGEGLKMRTDGYVKVEDLVCCPTSFRAELCISSLSF
jgi:2'-phosphotransferase